MHCRGAGVRQNGQRRGLKVVVSFWKLIPGETPMRKRLITGCLLLGALTGNVHAEVSCDKKPMEMTSQEQLECSIKAAEQAERKMQKAYQHALRSQHNRSLKSKLAASQQAWERYRRLQCNYVLDSMGEATEGPSWYQGCMQDMANERVKWL
jgi:uncharacterized protein YecT (DUF1311 family)